MKTFKKIHIEITNVCNLACSFCPTTKRKLQFMDIDTFQHILQQIDGYTKYVYLHLKGEPLLHPQLDQILKLCNERSIHVNITTNGTLIHKVKDTLLNNEVRQINFSIHSFDGNDTLMNMEEYLDQILDFIKIANEKTNTIISLRFWNLTKDNITNKEKQRNHHILEYIEKFFDLTYHIEEVIVPGKGIKIKDRIYLNQDVEFKWPSLEETEVDTTGYCYGLRDHVGILADGTVVPCCLDGEAVINLGNIHNEKFSDIIQSTRAQEIYDGFSNRIVVEELCQRCDFRRRFNK